MQACARDQIHPTYEEFEADLSCNVSMRLPTVLRGASVSGIDMNLLRCIHLSVRNLVM